MYSTTQPMPRYFCEGREISRLMAQEIEAENKRIMERGDLREMMNIKFVMVMNNPKDWRQ